MSVPTNCCASVCTTCDRNWSDSSPRETPPANTGRNRVDRTLTISQMRCCSRTLINLSCDSALADLARSAGRICRTPLASSCHGCGVVFRGHQPRREIRRHDQSNVRAGMSFCIAASVTDQFMSCSVEQRTVLVSSRSVRGSLLSRCDWRTGIVASDASRPSTSLD